jgi:hypothetical protein
MILLTIDGKGLLGFFSGISTGKQEEINGGQ